MYFVYFVKSEKDGSYYVGSTEDVDRRVAQHNAGKTRSLKSKIPVHLVYTEEFETVTEARKREIRIKESWQTKREIIQKITNL